MRPLKETQVLQIQSDDGLVAANAFRCEYSSAEKVPVADSGRRF
jgi:hypothetical protein